MRLGFVEGKFKINCNFIDYQFLKGSHRKMQSSQQESFHYSETVSRCPVLVSWKNHAV